jgi:hypothetical protein
VADIAVYILTGILPIEAQIHIRALGLFNNVCRQAEDSSEKALARRQLIVKPDSSATRMAVDLKQWMDLSLF